MVIEDGLTVVIKGLLKSFDYFFIKICFLNKINKSI